MSSIPSKLQLISGSGILITGAILTLVHLQTQDSSTTLRDQTAAPEVSQKVVDKAEEPTAEVTVNGQKVTEPGTTTMQTPGGGTASVTISGNGASVQSNSPSVTPPVQVQVNSSNGSTSSTSTSSSFHSSSGNFSYSSSSSNVNVSGGAKVEVHTNH